MKAPKWTGTSRSAVTVHRRGAVEYVYLEHAGFRCRVECARSAPGFDAEIAILKQWLEGEARLRKPETPTLATARPVTFGEALDRFFRSVEWMQISPASQATRRHYYHHARLRWGDASFALFDNKAIKAEFRDWLAQMARGQRGDGGLHVTASNMARKSMVRLLNWAVQNDWLEFNRLADIPAVHTVWAPRQDRVWTDREREFLSKATPLWRSVYKIALMTCARRFDLARFERSMIGHDGWLVFKPHKTARETNVTVSLPLGELPMLSTALDDLLETHSHARLFVTNYGMPWKTERSLGTSFAREVTRIFGPDLDLTMHDIRRTGMQRLRAAGCSNDEIASITGHAGSHGEMQKYFGDRRGLARQAYRKWAIAIDEGRDPLSPRWSPEVLPLRRRAASAASD